MDVDVDGDVFLLKTKHFTTYERSESIWRLNCIHRRCLYLFDSIDTYAELNGAVRTFPNWCRSLLCFSFAIPLPHIRFNPKLLFWSCSFFILTFFPQWLCFLCNVQHKNENEGGKKQRTGQVDSIRTKLWEVIQNQKKNIVLRRREMRNYEQKVEINWFIFTFCFIRW